VTILMSRKKRKKKRMNKDKKILNSLAEYTGSKEDIINDPDIAHLFIHHNKVIGAHLVAGLEVEPEEVKDGVHIRIQLKQGTVIKKPVHLCFGMFPEKGIQKILMDVDIQKNSKISILAHCVFPNAVDITHIMDAKIKIEEAAEYQYFERHVHGEKNGAKVYPKAVIELGKSCRFKTEFELLQGRVGLIEINLEAFCEEKSIMEMIARINGIKDDIIKIKETGYLNGDYSRGALTTRVALRNSTKAEVYNKLTASGAYARGHVDCKEIVQDEGIASAIPIVEVNHPKAHVTHEAAIGSVDSKQLATLMSRGLSEDKAVELIIKGLLT